MGSRTVLTLWALLIAAGSLGLLAVVTGCGPQQGRGNVGNNTLAATNAPEQGGGGANGGTALCTPGVSSIIVR